MNFGFSILDFRALARRANVWRRLKAAELGAAGAKGNLERANHLEQMYENACERADSMRERAEQWEKLAGELKARLEGQYLRRPSIVMETQPAKARKDLERLMVLAGLAENDSLWQTVLSYADEHERTEREAALKPEAYPAGAMHAGRAMTDGERHYNAGRAASAYDFATALRDLWQEAQLEARKLKGES